MKGGVFSPRSLHQHGSMGCGGSGMLLGWLRPPCHLTQLSLYQQRASTAATQGRHQQDPRRTCWECPEDDLSRGWRSCSMARGSPPHSNGGSVDVPQRWRGRRRRRPFTRAEAEPTQGPFQGPMISTEHPTTKMMVLAGAGSGGSPSSTLPVEPSGETSTSEVYPADRLRGNAASGVPGPSVPAATTAVARGDVANGLSMFLHCMSRRRLKLAAAKAAKAAKAAAAGASGTGETVAAKQGGVPACNMFLRVLGDAGRIDDCVVAYEAMVSCELRPTIVTFSTLISRAGACGRVLVAERFFREMLEAGITPDVQAMNSLINAFSKAGSPDQALHAFNHMSHYGLSPSIITYNSLIDACGRSGDVDRARQVFSRLKKDGLSPNDRTFSALIHSHAVHGQLLTEEEKIISLQGFADHWMGAEMQLDHTLYADQMNLILQTRNDEWEERLAAKNEEFLANSARAEGAVQTESGMVFQTITEGTGAVPLPTDVVKVHYHGTLIDGSMFDSSVTRGAAVTFALDGAIKGWAEGVQLMRVGGKSRLTIPPELAYGEEGTGPIPPNATLVFEVELLEIEEEPLQED